MSKESVKENRDLTTRLITRHTKVQHFLKRNDMIMNCYFVFFLYNTCTDTWHQPTHLLEHIHIHIHTNKPHKRRLKNNVIKKQKLFSTH